MLLSGVHSHCVLNDTVQTMSAKYQAFWVFEITQLFTHTFLDLQMNAVINRAVRGNAQITALQPGANCLHWMCQCPTVLRSAPSLSTLKRSSSPPWSAAGAHAFSSLEITDTEPQKYFNEHHSAQISIRYYVHM